MGSFFLKKLIPGWYWCWVLSKNFHTSLVLGLGARSCTRMRQVFIHTLILELLYILYKARITLNAYQASNDTWLVAHTRLVGSLLLAFICLQFILVLIPGPGLWNCRPNISLIAHHVCFFKKQGRTQNWVFCFIFKELSQNQFNLFI
jgi:hypothetical protein